MHRESLRDDLPVPSSVRRPLKRTHSGSGLSLVPVPDSGRGCGRMRAAPPASDSEPPGVLPRAVCLCQCAQCGGPGPGSPPGGDLPATVGQLEVPALNNQPRESPASRCSARGHHSVPWGSDPNASPMAHSCSGRFRGTTAGASQQLVRQHRPPGPPPPLGLGCRVSGLGVRVLGIGFRC